MSADVLALTVPIDGAYPSQNTLFASGARGGRKTPEYKALRVAVKESAEAEMARVGWTTAAWLCAVAVTVYHRRAPGPDASNIGKAECDGLTDASVWLDDKLGRPPMFDTEFDPDGRSRVVIVVRRRYPPYVPRINEVQFEAKRLRTERKAVSTAAPASPPPSGKVVLVNGVPVPYDVAMQDVRKNFR